MVVSVQALNIKPILFLTQVVDDGLGDIGHLVDIANPVILEKYLPKVDSSGSAVQYKPIYAVICSNPTPKRLRFIIESMKENGMIKDDGITFDPNRDDELEQYIQTLLEKNPHFYLYGDRMSGDSVSFLTDLTVSNITAIKVYAAFLVSYVERERLSELLTALYFNQRVFSTKIKEHGKRIDTSHVNLNEYSNVLGFYPWCCGVFLKEAEAVTLEAKAKLLMGMHNRNLLQALLHMDEKDVSYEKALDFLKKKLFIPAYFHRKQTSWVCLLTLACSKPAKTYHDVVFYGLQGIEELQKNHEALHLLKEHGFSKITVYSNRTAPYTFDIPGAEGDRQISIYQGYELNNPDYYRLFQMAQCFGGCAGDKSLELVLSNHLIPFYEEARDIKLVAEPLVKLASSYCGDESNLPLYIDGFSYLRKLPTEKVVEMSLKMIALIDNHFESEWATLIDVCQKQFNTYDKLAVMFEQSLFVQDFYQKNIKQLASYLKEHNDIEALKLLSHPLVTVTALRYMRRCCLKISELEHVTVFLDALIRYKTKDLQEPLYRNEDEIEQDRRFSSKPQDLGFIESSRLQELIQSKGLSDVDIQKRMSQFLRHENKMGISDLTPSP